MSEETHAAGEDQLSENLEALASLLEEMRNREGEDRHLLFEKALELVHTCQSLLEVEEMPA